MILKLRVLGWRITFTIAPVADTFGVNSNLPDGNHIIMWDFDCKTLNEVIHALDEVQELYLLPAIYILETKPNQCYIAYSFKRVPWKEAVEIVAATPGVCYNFFKYSVYREHFTLRVGSKGGTTPKLAAILLSPFPETANIRQLRSWVRYETLRDGWKSRVLEANIDGRL